MEYRYLGKSGLQVSVLSFGSWVTFSNQIKTDDAVHMMEMAYDAGINFFDNAEVYASGESEVLMGKILKTSNFALFYCGFLHFWTSRTGLSSRRGREQFARH